MAKEKDRASKLEAIAKEATNEMNKASKSYTELIVERTQEVDPSMDFLSISKKIAMQKFYSKDP
jgi:cellobiose-specific phosphotransferase system component IIA